MTLARSGASATLDQVRAKEIRTSPSDAHTSCDVCGRTLLRGEEAQLYLDGGAHRAVCELCTARAAHEGWIPEGAVPAYDGRGAAADRRRSLLGRLRRRREAAPDSEASLARGEDPNGAPWPPRIREPRHVRAIPTSVDHKIAAAIEAFNGSEHRRTVLGVARSLGPPTVSVRPVEGRASVVHVVVSWELCWYRYEVDLADEEQGPRVAAQGSELHELAAEERHPNAICDEYGALAPVR